MDGEDEEGPEEEGEEVDDGGHTHSMLTDDPCHGRVLTACLSEVSTARIFDLLASSGLRHILHSNGWSTNLPMDEEGEDEEDNSDYFPPELRRRHRERRNKEKPPFPKVPSDAGTELMSEGHFGTDQYYIDRLKKRKMAFASNLMWRELGVDSHGVRRRADQSISQVSRATDTSRGRPPIKTHIISSK